MRRALKTVDTELNRDFGPYPVFVLVSSDPEHDPSGLDAVYSDSDRKLLTQDLSSRTTVSFIEIPMYSGRALESNMTMEQFDRWNSGKDGGV